MRETQSTSNKHADFRFRQLMLWGIRRKDLQSYRKCEFCVTDVFLEKVRLG